MKNKLMIFVITICMSLGIFAETQTTIIVVMGHKKIVEKVDASGLTYEVVVCEKPYDVTCTSFRSQDNLTDSNGDVLVGTHTDVSAFTHDSPSTGFGGINIELEVDEDSFSGERSYKLTVPNTRIYTNYKNWYNALINN